MSGPTTPEERIEDLTTPQRLIEMELGDCQCTVSAIRKCRPHRILEYIDAWTSEARQAAFEEGHIKEPPVFAPDGAAT